MWLPARIHAMLKALAAAKRVPMSQYAEVYLSREIEARYMEAVSIVEAVAATGLTKSRTEDTREASGFAETDFHSGDV